MFVVEYLIDKDNKKQCVKKVFDEFKDVIQFCKKLEREKKVYLIHRRNRKV